MRETFLEWLSAGNAKKFSPPVCVSCLDKISEYAVHKKICSVSLWDITQHSVFKPIYWMLDVELLRITDRSTYRVFIVAGRLYLKFLKEKPLKKTVIEPTTSTPDDDVVAADALESDVERMLKDSMVTAEENVFPERLSKDDIDPEDVIAWLVTQPNAYGTLYLENVVRQYMSSLRFAPSKLFSLSLESRNVFACHTVAELKALWDAFKTAPNYKQVNNSTSGALSAGLGCLSRYLEHIASTSGENTTLKPASEGEVAHGSVPNNMLIKTLSEHFPNGFRINSPIELLRLRRFVVEDFGEEIALSDEGLTASILSCGTGFDEKVYIVGTDAAERIKNEIDSAVADGTEVIFYSAFYEQNEDWLFPASVISEDMLKNILTRLYSRFVHKTNYFAPEVRSGNEFVKIRREVLRVWANDILLSYEQLSERLPYIPVDKIKYVLAQNGDFVWNAKGVYTHIGKVDITDEEHAAIADYVATAYRKDGYASFKDIPLGEIAERNYELSLTPIHNVAFAIVLADKYDRRGKIITRKGDTLDVLSIMKEHCRSLEKCSLQDLLDFEHKLTGKSHRGIPMEAGYTIMVRVDEDSYVAEKHVHFDAVEIDSALEHFVTGNYLPLKSVTTFVTFPDCGQAWNLFLLESYCHRFSGRFHFELLAVNSRNAGAIVRKDCTLSYIEIMADAVASSNVVLTKAAIEDFLCSNGYIGRRSYAKADELIELAKALRERRD